MRCNLIDPFLLTDQHLLAEKRELRMIPPLLLKKLKNQSLQIIIDSVPKQFCLGTGHMNFWINKFLYLEKRYALITQELTTRGFHLNPTLTFDCTISRTIGCYQDWIPTDRDITIIKKRIKEKLLLKPDWYRFYSSPITLSWIHERY